MPGTKPPMTLEQIKAYPKDFITPEQASGALECDPQLIRLRAREAPEKLGFNIIRVGNRTKIPRRAFIKYMEGEN